MQAELLTIGAELTSGATVNTNAAYLSRRLADLGIACQRHTTVSDERPVLIYALQEALSRAELVITTGGLGPTFDDITMAMIAEAIQRPLVTHRNVASRIRHFYARRHRQLQQAALRQASLPQGGVALLNPIGTAPGLWLQLPRPHPKTLWRVTPEGRPLPPGADDGDSPARRGRRGPAGGRTRPRGVRIASNTLIIALPGVPGEMRAIMEQHVVPRLKRWSSTPPIEHMTLRTVGVPELTIEHLLRQLHIPPTIQVGLYPQLRAVDIRLTAISARPAQQTLARLEGQLRRKLGMAVYGTEAQTLEGVVGALLVKRHQTLAIAESCTGGLVSNRITDVPGSSRYLRGSIVAYHNDLKRQHLGVPAQTLTQHGAVSAQTAQAMAKGIRDFAGADLGLSITGIAGPSGGSAKKPVGLVYLGLADHRRARTLRCQFFGDRDAIKTQAAQTALDWLRRYLLGKKLHEV